MMERKTVKMKPAYPKQQIRWTRLGLFATLGFALLQFALTGCATTNKPPRLELPPVTDIPTGIHHQGKFVWNDLITDDVAAAKSFYGQLFGWTFEQFDRYTVVKNGSQSIGGMLQVVEKAETAGEVRWVCSLSVADVDKAALLTTEEGGTVHEGPLDMLNRGRAALVNDPQGAELLLLYATGGDPEDKEPIIGSWLWHELWSYDTEASLGFYQKLAGYDYEGEQTDYLILLKDEQWRAGIRSVSNPELGVRWVPVVRVANTEETAELAKELGGKLLFGPSPTPSGSVALLSDPSEALLIIQSWAKKTSEQEK
ncbi:MAG: VOC family protein [Desulfuromusa sp.]|nr:VOC family protein [Desulfuromusa sp.]